MLKHDEADGDARFHPGLGIEAACKAAFDNPLIQGIRALIDVVVFQDDVRKHPERYLNDPRARAILIRNATPASSRRGVTFAGSQKAGSRRSSR